MGLDVVVFVYEMCAQFDRNILSESYVINFNQVDIYGPALGFPVFTLIRENLVQSHA